MSGGIGGGEISKLKLLDAHKSSGAESTYTFTPATELDADTYSEIIVVCRLSATAAFALQAQLSGDAGANYNDDQARISLGVQTLLNHTNVTQFEIINSALIGAQDEIMAIIHFTMGTVNAAAFDRNSHSWEGTTDVGITKGGGQWHDSSEDSTKITSITIKTSASTWKANSFIDIYGVLRS